MMKLYRYWERFRSIVPARQTQSGTRPAVARPQLEELEPRLTPSSDLLSNPALSNPAPNIQVVPSASVTPAGLPGQPLGFSPQQISQAYGFNQISFNNGTVKGNGSGQTIAIVDPYSQPDIVNDLKTFDSTYGLAAPPSFTIVNEYGGTALPAADTDWGLEESLDVEWAHAMAPGAKILLVEANSTSWSDLLTAVNYARQQPGVSVVSMSWGGSEGANETQYDGYFTTPSGHNGITFVAASGDSGSTGAPLYPAVSPNVLSVGGTQLGLTSTGGYGWETAWSGSGGGISAYESQPQFQKGIVTQTSTERAVPDVAYNASSASPYAVYDSYSYSGWVTAWGTSAGVPQWAALIAIADQGRALNGLGTLNGASETLPALYQLPSTDFHDVTAGTNGAYSAGPGYDPVTGRGSPVANKVVSGLVEYGTPGTSPWVVKPATATSNLVTGRTAELSVLGGDYGGASDLTYTWWALSGPAGAPLPTYSLNGTNAAQNTQVTFYKAGTYVLRVTIENPTGKMVSSDISVTVEQTPTSVAITPSNPEVADGGTLQFQATARDQFGTAMSTQPTWTWKLTSGVGSLSSSGLYRAPSSGTGNATVQATAGTLTGSMSVSVGPVPVAPSNLSAVVISSQQVNLSWRDNSSNEVGFILQRSTNGGSWTTITKVAANVTTFSDQTVRSGQTYSYRVCAYNSFGDSAFSNTTGAVTPGVAGTGTAAAVQPQVIWDGESIPPTANRDMFIARSDYAADLDWFLAGLALNSNNHSMITQAGTQWMPERSPSDRRMNEDAIWLAWSNELMPFGTSTDVSNRSGTNRTGVSGAEALPNGLVLRHVLWSRYLIA
jgi:hypothetical protein